MPRRADLPDERKPVLMKISMMSYTMARGQWGQDPDVAQLCELTRELGLDAIDWVGTYGHDPDEIRKITSDFGIACACHTFGARLQVADEAERAAAMDVVKEGLENAVRLGTDKVMVVLSGIPGQDREQTRAYAIESLQKVVPMGQEMGVAVSVEHFPGAASPFAISADMNKAIAEVPGLKVTYDNGNVFIGGEEAPDGYTKSKEHVVHAHFKDWVRDEEGMEALDGNHYRGALIGEGLVDPWPCLQAMGAGGYEGYINFEYEGREYTPEEAMRKGLPPLLEMLEKLQ